MRLKSATALVALLAPATTFVHALSYGFPYGHEQIRGVSLGGWLSIEVHTAPLRQRQQLVLILFDTSRG